MGQPSDIANGVSYLLSPGAAWVTGEVLRVNGGSLI
jgi:3-oxoacyl-[acyl-carrier protein] reductase